MSQKVEETKNELDRSYQDYVNSVEQSLNSEKTTDANDFA
jgi:hypothetical protein